MAISHRICLVGAGQAAAHHVAVLQEVAPGARVAVVGREASAAEAFRVRHGLERAHDSLSEALGAGYDAFVVATPPTTHAALVEELVSHDANVLVEKPVVAEMGELQRLWPVLEAARGTVMVGENQHYAPQNAWLLRQLGSADLGRPILVQVTRMIRSPLRTWRADPELMPLGALHEAGIHWIRKLRVVTDWFADDPHRDVEQVTAMTPANRTTDTPGEDTAVVLARHGSGAISQLVHSWAIAHRTGFFDLSKVLCERGAIYFDARGRVALAFRGLRPRPSSLSIGPRGDRNGYAGMWRDFLGCIDSSRAPSYSLGDAWSDFAYLDAAYRSMASACAERPVPVPSTDS